MAEDTKRTGFTETYWNLHRNSLLFSTALLVFNLPGVELNQSQSFLIFTAKDIAHWWILAGLFAAATYALVAYLLEWWHEAAEQYRKDQPVLRNAVRDAQETAKTLKRLIEATEAASDVMMLGLNRVQELVGELTEQLTTRMEASTVEVRIDTWKMNFQSRLHAAILKYVLQILEDPENREKLQRTEHPLGAPLWIQREGQTPDQSESERWQSMLPAIPGAKQAIDELVDQIITIPASEVAILQLAQVHKDISDRSAQEQRDESLQSVLTLLRSQTGAMSRIRRLFANEARFASARVIGLGILVPSAVYTAAIILAARNLF